MTKELNSGFPPDSQSAFDKAKEHNLEVVVPKMNQLQLDIDSEQAYQQFLGTSNRVFSTHPFGAPIIEVHPSRSGGEKRHITLTFPKDFMSNTEKILLQAVLGSDPMREFLSYVQVLNRDPFPILLLETKPAVAISQIEMPTPIQRQIEGKK